MLFCDPQLRCPEHSVVCGSLVPGAMIYASKPLGHPNEPVRTREHDTVCLWAACGCLPRSVLLFIYVLCLLFCARTLIETVHSTIQHNAASPPVVGS